MKKYITYAPVLILAVLAVFALFNYENYKWSDHKNSDGVPMYMVSSEKKFQDLKKNDNPVFSSSLTEQDLVDGNKYGDLTYVNDKFEKSVYKIPSDSTLKRFVGETTVRGVPLILEGTGAVEFIVDKNDISKLPQYYFSSINGHTRNNEFYDTVILGGYSWLLGKNYDEILPEINKAKSKLGKEITITISDYMFTYINTGRDGVDGYRAVSFKVIDTK